MFCRRAWLLAAALSVSVGAGIASAQVPITPTPVTREGNEVITVNLAPAGLDGPELPLDVLTRKYRAGDWRATQQLAAELLHDITCSPTFFDAVSLPTQPCSNGRRGFDLTRGSVVLIWTGRDFKGDPALFSMLLPQPFNDPYKSIAPGIRRIYQLFITDQPGTDLAARYVATETENPLINQIPAFVTAGLGPLFGVAAKVTAPMAGRGGIFGVNRGGTGQIVSDVPPVKHFVRLSTVDLPMARSQNKADFVATVPARRDLFGKDAEALAAKLQFTDVFGSDCGKRLAEALAAETIRVSEHEPACAADGGSEAECRKVFDAAFKTVVARVSQTCGAQREDASAMTGVERKFRELVDGVKGTRAAGDMLLTNSPKTRFSLGALTSFAFRASLKSPRVKLDNAGKYIADPLPRQLTMVVVNVAVSGYQAASPVIGWSQRVRPFVGFVVQPDVGVAGGVSWLLIKNLGVNAGIALLAVPVAEAGKNIGDVPVNAKDPYKIGRAATGFFGVSFNFGK